MRLNFSLLFVLISIVSGYGQFQSDEDYLKTLDSYPNSFRQQIETALIDNDAIQLEMITTPNTISNNFYLRQLVPIIRDHSDNIDLIITFGMIKESNGDFVFQSRKDEADIYRWMAIKNVYPDQYIDFLETWAKQYSSVYVDNNDLFAVYDVLVFDAKIIQTEADRLESIGALEGNSKVLSRIDAPIVKVNGQELAKPFFTENPEEENCCDFNACLKSQYSFYPDNPLEEVKWWKDHMSCIACLEGNVAACPACTEQLAEDAADFVIAVEKCGNDACEVTTNALIECPPTEDGISTFCNQYTSFYGLGPLGFDVTAVECLECPYLTIEKDGVYIHLPEVHPESLENKGDKNMSYSYSWYTIDPETLERVYGDQSSISVGGKVDFGDTPPETKVFVTIDKYDCHSEDSYIIPTGCVLFDEFQVLQYPGECGSCNGQIEVILSGGSEEYEINVIDSDGNSGPEINSDFNFTNLCEGMYTVLAKDLGNDCESTITVMVESNDFPKYTFDVVGTCSDGNYGEIKLMCDNTACVIDGNTTPILKDKNGDELPANPNTASSNKGNLRMSGLSPGDYKVTVSNGECSETIDITVPVRPVLEEGEELKIELLYKNDGCDGNTGEAMVKVTGGYPPYELFSQIQTPKGLINGNDGNDIVEGVYFGNLISGNQMISVLDACGHPAGPILVNIGKVPISIDPKGSVFKNSSKDCENNDRAEGSISFAPSSVNAPLSYIWSNGDKTNPISNLTEGIYFCTVTDAIGLCSAEFFGDIKAPKDEDCDCKIEVTHFVNPFECLGAAPICIGEITIDVPQGATVNWTGDIGTNASSSKKLTGLCTGTITAEVTSDDCTTSQTFKIECCSSFSNGTFTEITPVQISGNVDSPNRSININVSGGSSTKIYSWSSPTSEFTSSEKNISGLELGKYCLTVNDGCTEAHECFEIFDCIDLELTTTPTCEGQSTGTAYFSTDPEINSKCTFFWGYPSQGKGEASTNPYYTGLSSGKNFGAVQYGNCPAQGGPFIIETFPTISVSATIEASCTYHGDAYDVDQNNGGIALTVEGPSPISFDWSTGSNLETLSDLAAGDYTLTTTDGNGCTKEWNFTVPKEEMECVPVDPTEENDCTSFFCTCKGETTEIELIEYGDSPTDCKNQASFCVNSGILIDDDVGQNILQAEVKCIDCPSVEGLDKCDCLLEVTCRSTGGVISTYPGDAIVEQFSGGTGMHGDPYYCYEQVTCKITGVEDIWTNEDFEQVIYRKNLLVRIDVANGGNLSRECTSYIFCDKNGDDKYCCEVEDGVEPEGELEKLLEVTNPVEGPCHNSVQTLITPSINICGTLKATHLFYPDDEIIFGRSIKDNSTITKTNETNNPNKVNFAVYPNPTKGKVNIEIWDQDNKINNYTYVIHSVLGNKITEGNLLQNKNSVDLKNIPKGILILTIYKNEQIVKVSKIIYIK